MNFIQFESEQKLRGGFYTAPLLADFLVRWIEAAQPRHILEPSCGDGAFFRAMAGRQLKGLRKVTGFELDAREAVKAANCTKLPTEVHARDFLSWYLLNGDKPTFDAVVGNPPFVRYQYLPQEQQALAEKIFGQLRLPFTKHTNAWVPFVLASIRLLKPGGRLAMVVPSELFHIPHAQSLRSYLGEQCSKILIFDPEEIWFQETLQGTVLLLAEKKRKSDEKCEGVAVIPVSDRAVLSSDPEHHFRSAAYANGETIQGKWMPVLLSKKERALVGQLRQHKSVAQFSDIAAVDVGIVTGANKFFLVPDDVVEAFSLQQWAHPMFGRSDHVEGLIYTATDHKKNRSTGLAANFLWFREGQLARLPSNVRRYLATGVRQNLHTRFKCRTRRPWYRVPSVYTAPVAMLKRAHHFPRLVLNRAGAFTTDTAYRISAKAVTSEALVLSFVNSLTCLSAELEGRHYGGGVLELVPSEIERLLLPKIDVQPKLLVQADAKFRQLANDEAFLCNQDRLVLGQLGLSLSEQGALHGAWQKLRDRRHRIPEAPAKAA